MFNGKPSPIMKITPAGMRKLRKMQGERSKRSWEQILEDDEKYLEAVKKRVVRSPFSDPNLLHNINYYYDLRKK